METGFKTTKDLQKRIVSLGHAIGTIGRIVGIGSIGRVAMTANLTACARETAALNTAWVIMGKQDPTMALNGTLAKHGQDAYASFQYFSITWKNSACCKVPVSLRLAAGRFMV